METGEKFSNEGKMFRVSKEEYNDILPKFGCEEFFNDFQLFPLLQTRDS